MILYLNKTVALTKGDDGFYRDDFGTIYALKDDSLSVDDKTRCGIGMISVPEGWLINDACSAHDYAYSSPVYQAFHTRAEADSMLENHMRLLGYPVIGWLFKKVSKLFGASYWEGN